MSLAISEVERRTGMAVITEDERRLAEQAMTDLRATWRELDLLGYSVLDYLSGNPAEIRPETRRSMARKSLVAWMQDPQAFRATELMIDFAFGRGVPQPRAKEAAVQRVLDDFWNDSANKVLVSTAEGQRKLARDLILQANVFPLIFDGGDDGAVKVGLLTHDSVENVVRDDDNRLMILYYTARDKQAKWDYDKDQYVMPPGQEVTQKVTYYEHWSNVQSLEDEGQKVPKPSKQKMGDGKVYHLVDNATTEMAFGVPMMQRTLRWFAAYNDFQAARVDMMKAAAAFIMKRKVKGTPNQLAKMATRAISRQSPLSAGGVDPMGYPVVGRAASILNENDMVDHESLKLDSGAAQAVQDADMLHGQIAAGTGLPKHYLGSSDANLATATAMELFVIKHVEAFQQVFESFYRALFDLVIERSVESGVLDQYEEEEAQKEQETQVPPPDVIFTDVYSPYMAELVQQGMFDGPKVEEAQAIWRRLMEDYEEQTSDEQVTERDLSYEFNMPNPLRRMMTDLVTACTQVATTFDPNNTNNELSRTLLSIIFGEAFDVDDPAGLVEAILPPGYVDPMIAMAAQQQQQQPPPGPGGEEPPGPGRAPGEQPNTGAAEQPAGAGNRYGAPMQSQNPEEVPVQEALVLRGRGGREILSVPLRLRENTADTDERIYMTVRGRARTVDEMFDQEIGGVVADELERLALGNGSRNGGE